jgi:hypothetical protein
MGLKLDVKQTVKTFAKMVEPILIKKTRATVFLPANDVEFIRNLGDGNFNRGITILLSPYEDLEITNIENLCMLQLKKGSKPGPKPKGLTENVKKNQGKRNRGRNRKR